MDAKKKYYYKIFMKGGLGIDLVSDQRVDDLWVVIRYAKTQNEYALLVGFDDESEETPSAVVTFMPDEILAIVQRDLDMVKKQAAMQRLAPNGPRLM